MSAVILTTAIPNYLYCIIGQLTLHKSKVQIVDTATNLHS